jgi:molybdopterin synthase sulfur carrier subunit
MARVTLVVPSLLRELLGMPDGTAASFEAESLSEAMPALRRAFPKLAPHVWDETGALRKHVQVYVGEWNVRWSDVPDNVWHDGACVRVAMAVSGG